MGVGPCRDCGKDVGESALACPNCGAETGKGLLIRQGASETKSDNVQEYHESAAKKCVNCQAVLNVDQDFCHKCGKYQEEQSQDNQPKIVESQGAPYKGQIKSRGRAAFYAFFLGSFGIHKFYLGRPFQGVIYLLLCTTYVPLAISILEAIIYLSISDKTFQKKYVARKKSGDNHRSTPAAREHKNHSAQGNDSAGRLILMGLLVVAGFGAVLVFAAKVDRDAVKSGKSVASVDAERNVDPEKVAKLVADTMAEVKRQEELVKQSRMSLKDALQIEKEVMAIYNDNTGRDGIAVIAKKRGMTDDEVTTAVNIVATKRSSIGDKIKQQFEGVESGSKGQITAKLQIIKRSKHGAHTAYIAVTAHRCPQGGLPDPQITFLLAGSLEIISDYMSKEIKEIDAFESSLWYGAAGCGKNNPFGATAAWSRATGKLSIREN